MIIIVLILQHCAGNAACLGVSSYIVVVCRTCYERSFLHSSLDNLAHLQESAMVVTERFVYHLVGSIDDTRHVAALIDCLVSHLQTAELLHIWLEEFEWLLEQVESVAIQWQSVGVREGLLYGQTHVWNAQLCLDGTVAELHCAVND